ALEGQMFDNHVDERPGRSHSIGGGADLLLRYHFLTGETWSLYVDGGAGLVYSGKSQPRGETNLTFNPEGGVGGPFRLTDRVSFMGGCRWYHLSNGKVWGHSNSNPGFDGLMGYAGLMISY